MERTVKSYRASIYWTSTEFQISTIIPISTIIVVPFLGEPLYSDLPLLRDPVPQAGA